MGSPPPSTAPLAVVSAVNTASAAIYWVSVDHLNRPIKMTTAAKASVWDAVWQPWGGIHSITGSATLDARFPGQWFQVETGLHYNWHRSYGPAIGRYTQPDPLGFVDGPSVYGYAGGSPLRAVDSSRQQTYGPPTPFTPTPSPFIYDPRLRDPQRPEPNHNYPYSFDPEIWLLGDVCKCSLNFTGASIYYQRCLRGKLNGDDGTYELGFDIPLTGGDSTVTHRFFRPD